MKRKGVACSKWMNKWMNEESWMRGQQTCPLTKQFSMWTVSSDVSIQRRHWQLLSVIYELTVPSQPTMWMMWCVKVDQNTGVYVLYSFSNSGVGSFTSDKNQISVSAVRRDLHLYGFPSLSEKTRKSNCLQMSLQRQHFLLSYLKTLRVGPAGVRTCDLPLSRPALSQLSQPGSGWRP